MKAIFTSIILLVFVSTIKADVYTFESVGNWNQVTNWDAYPGTIISSTDIVIISADITINTSVTINGNLTISSGVSLTNDWLVFVNGMLNNEGQVFNNTQLNLFGDCVSNGTWENSASGTLIVTGTGDFTCRGNFINHGGLLGYNSSRFYLEANFENNDYITFNGDFDIHHSNGQEFVNNGLVQFNGPVRLEGSIINTLGNNFNINWSSAMYVADHSRLENFGILNVGGLLEVTSLLNVHSKLGHVVVDGVVNVRPSVLEIL